MDAVNTHHVVLPPVDVRQRDDARPHAPYDGDRLLAEYGDLATAYLVVITNVGPMRESFPPLDVRGVHAVARDGARIFRRRFAERLGEIRQLHCGVQVPRRHCTEQRHVLAFDKVQAEGVHTECITIFIGEQLSAHQQFLDLVICNCRPRHGEGGDNGPHLEEVRVVTHFAQLHQDIRDLLVDARVQSVACLCTLHEFVVQEALPLRQRAHRQMLELARELLFHVALEAAEEIGAKDGVQLGDRLHGLLVVCIPHLDRLFQRV